jgi:hypothetical protein
MGVPSPFKKKYRILFLHFSQGNRARRADTCTGLAAFAEIGLLGKGLSVLHRENTDGTVIYTLFARLAF